MRRASRANLVLYFVRENARLFFLGLFKLLRVSLSAAAAAAAAAAVAVAVVLLLPPLAFD